MIPSEFKAFAKDVIKNKIKKPVCVISSPGVGKSKILQQVAQEEGCIYVDLRLAQIEPGDAIGIPYQENGITKWARPSWLPEKGPMVLVFEEFNRAPRDIRSAVMQALTENRINEHLFPEDTFIFGAINPDNGNHQVDELDTAYIRRFLMLKLEPNFSDFKKFFSKNPDMVDIVQFLSVEKRFLCQEEKFDLPSSGFRPSSWEDLGKFIPLISQEKPYDLFEVFSGLVGTEAALAFRGFLNSKNSPLTAKEIATDWPNLKKRFSEQKSDEVAFTIDSIAELLGFDEADKPTIDKKFWSEIKFRNILNFWSEIEKEYQVILYKKIDNDKIIELTKKFPAAKPDALKLYQILDTLGIEDDLDVSEKAE